MKTTEKYEESDKETQHNFLQSTYFTRQSTPLSDNPEYRSSRALEVNEHNSQHLKSKHS